MAATPFRHVTSALDRGVLVLTVTEPQLQGDAVADAVRREMLAAVAHHGAHNVVVDLGRVVSLSSTGFRPLLSLQRRLGESGGRLVLCNLTPTVAEAFRVTRLIGSAGMAMGTFEVRPDLNAAVANLTGTDAQRR